MINNRSRQTYPLYTVVLTMLEPNQSYHQRRVNVLQLLRLYSLLTTPYFTYDHRTLKTRLPVRSALFKQRTGGLVVRWVTTSEYPLLYVFVVLVVIVVAIGKRSVRMCFVLFDLSKYIKMRTDRWLSFKEE